MKVLSAVLLLVSAIIGTTFGVDEACPKISFLRGKEVFNKAEFVKITWKEAKRTNDEYAPGGCVSVKYTTVENKDDLNAAYEFYKDGKKNDVKYILESSRLVSAPEVDHKNNFKVKKEDKTPVNDMDYTILTTDYKTYSVAHGCMLTGTSPDKKRQQRISVFTHDGTISETSQGILEQILKYIEGVPKFSDAAWKPVEQDMKKCESSASIFGLSTALSVIVVLLSVLRN